MGGEAPGRPQSIYYGSATDLPALSFDPVTGKKKSTITLTN
jgi:hypothetical protein